MSIITSPMAGTKIRYDGHPDVGAFTAAEAAGERDRCIEAGELLNEERVGDDGTLSEADQEEFNTFLFRAKLCGRRVGEARRENFDKAAKGAMGSHTESMNTYDSAGGATPTGPKPLFVNASTGQPVLSLGHGDQLAAFESGNNRQATMGVGETVLAMINGEGGNDEFAANISGSDQSGGYLATPKFSKDVLDLARAASVVSRAGASTIQMDSNELHMARLTQDVTGHWRQEGAKITSSDTKFDRVTLRSHVVAAITTVTIELMEDATNMASVIENSMSQALGQAIDRAALFGRGAEAEPQGITNTDGISSETAVGTPDGYAELTSSVRQIMTANYPGDPSGLAWLGHPRDFATYDGLTDSTGQPLRPTPWASQLQPFATTSFSVAEDGGSNESTMIVGDMSQVVIGMKTQGVRLEIFREGSLTDGSETHNAVEEMKVHIRAYMRADVAVMRPNWITKLTGVTAA